MTLNFCAGFCQKHEQEENQSPYGLYNFINQLPFKIFENLKYSVLLCKSKMEKFQFDTDVNSLYTPKSPDVVDISSESENSFSIAPGDIAQLDERFRVNTTGSNLMSAFMGSALASLYVDPANTAEQNEFVGATGTQID